MTPTSRQCFSPRPNPRLGWPVCVAPASLPRPNTGCGEWKSVNTDGSRWGGASHEPMKSGGVSASANRAPNKAGPDQPPSYGRMVTGVPGVGYSLLVSHAGLGSRPVQDEDRGSEEHHEDAAHRLPQPREGAGAGRERLGQAGGLRARGPGERARGGLAGGRGLGRRAGPPWRGAGVSR